MSYIQTEGDKSDEKLLRRLLTEKMSEKDANKIISHVFSDLIKWTYDDAVFHLTQLFNFTDKECDQLFTEYDILSSSTTTTATATKCGNIHYNCTKGTWFATRSSGSHHDHRDQLPMSQEHETEVEAHERFISEPYTWRT